MLSLTERSLLCSLAWQAVDAAIANLPAPSLPPASSLPATLTRPGACFVTLKYQGLLRGCIGSLYPQRSLAEDVLANARAAALSDPRFEPVTANEQAGLGLSLSVLGPQHPMTVTGHDDLLRQLRPGQDGLVIAGHGLRATFLPSVWAQLPEPSQFIAHLRAKAGIGTNVPDADLEYWRYSTEQIDCGHSDKRPEVPPI